MSDKKMQKAFVIDEYDEKIDGLKIRDIPIPEPGEGEVQIQLAATSLNPVDWKIRKGYLKHYPTTFPVCLGWDIAGTISGVGYGVSQFKVGDEVYSYGRRQSVGLHQGTYCHYVTLPSSFVAMKPKNMDFVQSACIPLTALTAYQCVFDKGLMKKGDKVVIYGASGGVGSWGIQFCRIAECDKIICVASKKNHEYMKKLGATHCIDYNLDVAAEIKKIVPDGINKVMDFYGGDWMKKSESVVGKEGARFISIAKWDYKSPSENIVHDTVFVIPHAIQLQQIAKWVEEGKLTLEVSKIFDFVDIPKGTLEMETGHTRGKIGIKIL